MTKQLIFLDDERLEGNSTNSDLIPVDGDEDDFRIDPHTREIARLGIAAARQALAEAVRRAAARDQVAA